MNIEQERAAFEAWYRLHHGSLDVYGRDASGEYADKQVQGAFNVWQARAAQAPAADAQPGYAGVTVWVGDMKCTMEVPKQILKASRCDALLECFQKARHAIDAAPAQPAAQDQGEVQALRDALETIAAYPYSRDQEMGADAMRKVAMDALAATKGESNE